MLFKTTSNLVITTSRKPSQLTRRFTQFLKHYFNIEYINRGKTSFNKIILSAKSLEANILLVVTETKGNPSSINVYDLNKSVDIPIFRVYITVSLANKSSRINVNKDEILFINKVNELNEIFNMFEKVESKNKVDENYILIKDDDKNNNLATVEFYDNKGENTNYRIYLTGYKVKGD